jgi:hypothetical protein
LKRLAATFEAAFAFGEAASLSSFSAGLERLPAAFEAAFAFGEAAGFFFFFAASARLLTVFTPILSGLATKTTASNPTNTIHYAQQRTFS